MLAVEKYNHMLKKFKRFLLKVRLYFFTICINSDISVELPKTCTAIIALVFEVIFFSSLFKSKLKLFNLTSTNFGFRPACTIGHKEVDQQIAGIKHSSFCLKNCPSALLELQQQYFHFF